MSGSVGIANISTKQNQTTDLACCCCYFSGTSPRIVLIFANITCVQVWLLVLFNAHTKVQQTSPIQLCFCIFKSTLKAQQGYKSMDLEPKLNKLTKPKHTCILCLYTADTLAKFLCKAQYTNTIGIALQNKAQNKM